MKTLQMRVLNLSARRIARCTSLLLGALFIVLMPVNGQITNNGQTTNSGQLTRRVPPQVRDLDPSQMDTTLSASPIFYEKRLQMLNAAQHQSMVTDTDKLVKLIADLNSQINTSNSSSLTPEQLRMVAEIEKLAHSVRDKMRMSVRSAMDVGPASVQPYSPR